jgi:nitroreductase
MPDQFNNEPIADEKINLIIEAANWAPTHKKTEPWRFKILKGKSKDSLGDFLSKKYEESSSIVSEYKFKKLHQKSKKSAVVILICMQRDPKKSIPEWEEIASVAMAVQNMWLMATELNIGSYWSSPLYINNISEFIPLNKGEKCLGIFYMGNFNKKKQVRIPNPIEEKIKRFY